MAKRMSIATLKRWWRNTRTQSVQAVSSRLRLILRPLLRGIQSPQNSRSGFVLPTAALLLLVVSLVIAAVLLRTINRTEQVIGIREEKVIYNAATPAIDRAKAKIEYMFTEDPRLPAGVPSQERLLAMMLNDGSADTQPLPQDLYTLEGEDQIKINGKDVPAWAYRTDSDGDGQDDLTIAYSITYQVPNSLEELKKIDDNSIKVRAKNVLVRTGPNVKSAETNRDCPDNEQLEKGWLQVAGSTATLRKNFQIDAFAISDKENGTVAALEMQQDRQADRGNKWGAWFHNDLEVFPGPPFNWNGAMRTDASLFVGREPDRPNKPRLNVHLATSVGSCIATDLKSYSVISLADKPDSNEDYAGQVVSALINIDKYQGTSTFHTISGDTPEFALGNTKVDAGTDSVNDKFSPSDIGIDPLLLFTEDRPVFRGKGLTKASQIRDAATWEKTQFREDGRVSNEVIPKPLVDDLYRADDRYGPKPSVLVQDKTKDTLIELGVKTGDPISGVVRDELTTFNPVATGVGEPKDLGLDGYWERRAWREGMRVITGERLQLGNDPLPDPTDYNGEDLDIAGTNGNNNNREHETLQRRAMRDNLAAVQATAIYHHSSPGDLPVAALATTVHPGTAETLKRSSIFDKFDFDFGTASGGTFGGKFGDNPNEIPVDFFTGRGTNGWEFEVPSSYFSNAQVSTALQNLANFAGDPDGAFPPKQEAGRIHPYPQLTKWGNFSNLRRTLRQDLDSLADKSNKHTAALTLGMLAYNLQYLEAFTYSNRDNRTALQQLDTALQELEDEPCNPFSTTACTPAFNFDKLENGEVDYYTDEHLYGTGPNCQSQNNTVRDSQDIPIGEKSLNGDMDCADDIQHMVVYDAKQAQANKKVAIAQTPGNLPEAYQSGLEQRVRTATAANLPQRKKDAQLARLLYLKEQTKRDRTYGFRASPRTADQFLYTPKFLDPDSTTNPFTYGGKEYGGEQASPDNPVQVAFNCNFGPAPAGNNYFGLFTGGTPTAPLPGDANEEKQFLRIATAICGINEDTDADGRLDIAPPANNEDLNGNGKLDSVRFPSLFYLFPLQPQDQLAANLTPERRQPGNIVANTVSEPYLTDAYIQRINGGYQYQPIDINAIALKPKPINNWILPHEVINPANECDNDHAAANPNPNCSQFNVIIADTGPAYEAHRVAFKDSAFFDGREMMAVRALKMDLEMLTDKKTPGGDTWIPAGNSTGDAQSQSDKDGGIVYAFREDAVREDAIARPNGAAWGACDSFGEIFNNTCRMDATIPRDPPVNSANGISPKPVDFFADPDRRPHGFRLINGADLSRPAAGGLIDYGLTFVSDNPTYIQGNFNCHASGGNCDNTIEEFTQKLSDLDPKDASYSQKFYERNRRNKNFAKPGSDSWRTSELLVDSLTIVSDNFCDGSIEDGFLTVTNGINPGSGLRNRLGNTTSGVSRSVGIGFPTLSDIYGCQNPGEVVTSYLNQNRPNDASLAFNNWLRENPADPASPIKISPNGNPILKLGKDYEGQYFTFDAGFTATDPDSGSQVIKPLIDASEQYVNGVLISGVVPFRAYQSSGGLHNFPRFIERWDNENLNFSGSLLQINFSTYGTGPWDPDVWEPSNTDPEPKDQFRYYFPPSRRWGYDVALQLSNPGPISTRLISVSKNRSEYYRELPVDDPYINNLRCAPYKGKPIDPRAAEGGNCS